MQFLTLNTGPLSLQLAEVPPLKTYKKNPFSFLYLILLVIQLGGCYSMRPTDFSNETPRLTFEEYFVGPLTGSGVFYDRFGNIQASFVIKLRGEKTADGLILDEDLKYSTGETLKRIYTVKKIDDHHYQATADGVVGTANIESYGNALRWRYTLAQPIGETVWNLSFDDWMLLQPTGVILNRAKAYKFGIFLGEVIMSIQRDEGKY